MNVLYHKLMIFKNISMNILFSFLSMTLMTLLVTLLKYQFVEKLYPATVAGLEYSCYASDLGIVFKVSSPQIFYCQVIFRFKYFIQTEILL